MTNHENISNAVNPFTQRNKNFKKVKLGEVCEMNSGGTPRRGKDAFYGGKIPWVKISDIENAEKGFIYETEEYITLDGLKSINNRIFPKNTLLLAMYGSVGKVAISGIELSTNQAILGIRPKNINTISIEYCKYWFNYFKNKLISQAVGATLQNISLGLVKNIEIPLPDLATQQYIAAVLDQADALRQADQQLIGYYDKLVQSVFIEMFGDPVRNEKGWEVKRIREISDVSSGSTPSRDNLEYFGGNIPWVKTTEVNNKIIFDTEEKITELGFKNSSCRLNPPNSILVAMYGNGKTRGQIGLLGIEATTNQACAIIKPSSLYNSVFLYEYLKTQYDELRYLSRGGNQPNLNVGMIKDYQIIFPPLVLQEKFAGIVGQIEEQKAIVRQQAARSEVLFQALLQAAFS